MKVVQSSWKSSTGWRGDGSGQDADLVLAFAGSGLIGSGEAMERLRERYPDTPIVGCSTSGEIEDVRVHDESIVATAIRFDSTRLTIARLPFHEAADSYDAGRKLAEALSPDGLRHAFVLAAGIDVNGSDLVSGISETLPEGVLVTGGLAGDGERFATPWVLTGSDAESKSAVIVGFYGEELRVGCGSLGGWDSFGPRRRVTRSKGNILYELDGKSALHLYRQYLGEHAAGLPATGLLFPLSVQYDEGREPVVRTLLSIDAESEGLVFAGDIPEGSTAQLMKANFDRLIDGAIGAAENSYESIGSSSPDLAILISCVGRRMVLQQRIEEEVEGVREVLGPTAALTGFYSYGEISPFTPSGRCELHNQTMTITTFAEGR